MALQVFVYGTLKPRGINYQRYCAGKVSNEKPAIAQGQLFALPMGYPAMVAGEGWVSGFLLAFPDSAILRVLDELEDYVPGRSPELNEYQRQRVEVFDLEMRSLGPAWAYLMTLERVNQLQGHFLPSGVWATKSKSEASCDRTASLQDPRNLM